MENNFVEVVKLAVNDWPEYKKLRLEALQTEPQAFGSTYAETLEKPDSFWQSRLESTASGNGSWLLFARENQRLVGMIGAYIDENDAHAATIISVYVTKGARGRKISSVLMRAILSELKNSGITTARLGVNMNQQPAVSLYKNFGFQCIQVTTQVMGNGETADQMRMEKKLDE